MPLESGRSCSADDEKIASHENRKLPCDDSWTVGGSDNAQRIPGVATATLGVQNVMRRSSAEIQHVAGWTSTKQLATYDLTNADDILTKQLERRGLLAKKVNAQNQQTKICVCGAKVGFSEKICGVCKRVVDPKKIAKESAALGEIEEVFRIALEEPNMPLAKIIEVYRRRKLERM